MVIDHLFVTEFKKYSTPLFKERGLFFNLSIVFFSLNMIV